MSPTGVKDKRPLQEQWQHLHIMTPCLLGKGPGRWRSRPCPSTWMTLLPSRQALKPLIPTFCLLVMVVYGLGEKLRNFVVRIFIPQYHYPYAVALSFGQVLVSLLFLNLFHLLGLVPLKRYSRPLGEKLLVPAICASIYAVLTMWTKANSAFSSVTPLTVPMLPLLTVVLSFVLKLSSPPSVHMSILIFILSVSSVISTVSKGVSGSHPLEFVYPPLAVILHSVCLTWLAKVSEAQHRQGGDGPASAFDLYYVLLVNQFWILGLLWLVHPHSPWLVLSRGYWQTLLFHGYLLAILLLGMVLNFMVGMSALCVSPLAAALLYSARDLLQPFVRLL
ncbi:uncharacterized protein si:ch211-248a14.8 isoform X1 [Synchiropus splendidus]|uniref:uncharacterized protein si:ch211-248a14.8 isoform X1 n=2 Tax=Synchiropus splendidus TaxID=270530 RepID=UPI00237E397F|nr:uncharacterized protein si:ch211-248a14.8 isoform X1 [Synchiropus splendidus]